MAKLYGLIIFLLLSQTLQAQTRTEVPKKSCPENLTNEQIFNILMQAEFAGVQLEGANPECLEDEKFPHQVVGPDFSQEIVELNIFLVEEPKIEIKSIKLIDEFQNIYQINFTIKVTPKEQTHVLDVHDSATITIFKSERLKKKLGCGNFLERPKNIFIKPKCLSKKEKSHS